MDFDAIIGHQHIKKHLLSSLQKGRIPHAQLFVAPQGTGALPMALAYAKQLLCFSDKNGVWTENPSARLKFDKLVHPDLHFAFPVTTTDRIKTKPVSDLFIEEWRQFVLENPYRNVFDWMQYLGIEKKQGQIGVDEAQLILKKLSLKAYEGTFKVLIVWMAEKMNTSAANKLLKLIEEPPKNTVLILITENEDRLLKTITSRCQTLRFLPLPETIIRKGLQDNFDKSPQEAHQIAVQAQGNWHKACQLISQETSETVFEDWFILWIRTAFRAKGNAAVINDLIGWSTTIAGTGRETQKQFLAYCLSFFRQALLQNYKTDALVYLQPKTANFSLKKFAPFVNHANILEITSEIETASYHIERNGNAKIILLDLSIKLTRLLHQKAEA